MSSNVKHMKWWGWGDPDKRFDIENRPGLAPYIENTLGVKLQPQTPAVSFDSIELSPSQINPGFMGVIQEILDTAQITMSKHERILHAYGKSFRDVWRIRHGIVSRAPDIVLYPKTEEQVHAIVQAAVKFNVCIIPFGGGSNIAGCVEVKDKQDRMNVSLDLKLMNQVLMLDRQSGIARIQAGVLGPHLEEQLNQLGYSLGHFPDSFEYSTLGGWIATRSAGMQSDRYGKIEDMVLSLRMVTPRGTIVTRTVPKCANGINVNHLCIGSEGILGVITEATVMVHPLPAKKDYFGYLFPSFNQGSDAIYECVQRDCLPLITRLNDPDKTALSFAFKSRASVAKQVLAKTMSAYLRRVKGLDLKNVCLMIVSFAGDHTTFKYHKKMVSQIFRKHGGVYIGASPGRAFERGKYDFPYLRDYVMDCNMTADVSETATIWSNLQPLYTSAKASIAQAITETGVRPWVGCHISHNYHSGASLYFTFACEQKAGEELSQYLHIKKAAEDAFLRGGGTLSHHHAVGYEHLPWVIDDISTAGLDAIKALKQGMDPLSIMNPEKIIPSAEPLTEWGLTECFPKKFVSSLAPHQD